MLTGEMQVLDPDNNVVAAVVGAGTGDESFGEKDEITWKELIRSACLIPSPPSPIFLSRL